MIAKSPGDFRLLHFSDLHCYCFPFNVFTCFNKRAKGMLRQLFCPLGFETRKIINHFSELISGLSVDALCVTGDFTLTATKKEFLLAKNFINHLKETLSVPIYLLPGNHDVYTKKAFSEGVFYKIFPNPQLQQGRVTFNKISEQWWLVLLDCSYPNGWMTSHGKVDPMQISVLENFFLNIPADEKVIIANHYPLLATSRPYHDLINGKLLQNMLKKYSNAKIYIHGHDHAAAVYSCKDHYPSLILNSGSISDRKNARFNVIDVRSQGCSSFTMAIRGLRKKNSPLELELESSYELQF
ncbi:metallophosphoesterase family protein [Chlamydiifrater volucris]|uniref:metallophosphoesterase family protein n=1 Tax=Chlamydiifrater volucris TaxID=2681470 RepID=UPI001BD01E04|nr:metallophosphoesterase [Chlamydiifrater volucris]